MILIQLNNTNGVERDKRLWIIKGTDKNLSWDCLANNGILKAAISRRQVLDETQKYKGRRQVYCLDALIQRKECE